MPADNVLPFPYAVQPVQPIAHFIRLGETAYHRLATLHSSGHLPVQRVVVDASRLIRQRELLNALRASGAEIVLDTKAAELSALAKFQGYARGAPWAALGEGTPLDASVFGPSHPGDIFGVIARFAVQHRVDAVLSPGHYVGDPTFPGWFEIDRQSCVYLRRALDREGGRNIAIDYMLVVPNAMLSDDERRGGFTHGLADLPFENLWVRTSGFGSDASPFATRRFISALETLHNLGKPVIADYVGGFVGLAALAFGAVSGISHGIGERERFDAAAWHKPMEKLDGRQVGRAIRIAVPDLDRSVTVPELELLAGARGGKRLIVCNDRRCCPNGLRDTIADPRRHAAYQCLGQIRELASVPDLHREKHFLQGRLIEAHRIARQVKDLKPSPEEAANRKIDLSALMLRLAKHSVRQEKMLSTLEHLHERSGEQRHRSRPAALRNSARAESQAQTK